MRDWIIAAATELASHFTFGVGRDSYVTDEQRQGVAALYAEIIAKHYSGELLDAVVSVGVGGWTVHKRVKLVACPVPDVEVMVGDDSVTAHSIAIGEDRVLIRSNVRFKSEQELQPYLDAGWSRSWP